MNGIFGCTIASKINVTPKGVHLTISKLHSILVVANLLAHNNKSKICYCGQISLQSAAVNCSFSGNMTPLGVTLILLAMVHDYLEVEIDNWCHAHGRHSEIGGRFSQQNTRVIPVFSIDWGSCIWHIYLCYQYNNYIRTKDYFITGRANVIFCAVGLR